MQLTRPIIIILSILMFLGSASAVACLTGVTVALNTPLNDSIFNANNTMNFTIIVTCDSAFVTQNATLIGNFTGTWEENQTNLTVGNSVGNQFNYTFSYVPVNYPNLYWWGAKVFSTTGGDIFKYSTNNYTFVNNGTTTTTTTSTTTTTLKVYQMTTWNDTLVSDLSSTIGSGLTYSFGNVLFIGIFVLFIMLGTLYALGFTLDITIILLSAVVLAMSNLPALMTLYSTLPPWVGIIPIFITAILFVFAAMKIFRK